jgi:hypothetical protein
MALDSADGNEQPGPDLGIGQVLAERSEYLCFAG